MRHRAIILAAGLAAVALAGCGAPADDYAYDPYGRSYGPYASRYYDPYSGRYYAYEPAYSRPYYERYAYRYDTPARWSYRDNTWTPSRWDSSPYDRYKRARWGLDQPDP
jgi:hypothetical protein